MYKRLRTQPGWTPTGQRWPKFGLSITTVIIITTEAHQKCLNTLGLHKTNKKNNNGTKFIISRGEATHYFEN